MKRLIFLPPIQLSGWEGTYRVGLYSSELGFHSIMHFPADKKADAVKYWETLKGEVVCSNHTPQKDK